MAKLALFVILTVVAVPCGLARAYYDYPNYFTYRSQQHLPIISIDLDPQHQIDTSFRLAAREDRLRDMLDLLNHGAHIDSVSDRGRTALMYAARDCSIPIAHALLIKGANVNLKDEEGDTALIFATLESCLAVVKMLLKKPHLDVQWRDQSGKTALEYAADCASLDVDGPASQILHLLRMKQRMR